MRPLKFSKLTPISDNSSNFYYYLYIDKFTKKYILTVVLKTIKKSLTVTTDLNVWIVS